ncbi:hypothetical protein BG011_002489 [Mortierella polycephala]|uniref:Protein root UVB sensitive/RUS domain-containing protein n=1 Tax=Mortierella polycephala TaxID=41804 RepID=A0A9P6QDR7_9FUNG|nr:hypothetical protein BG011_002489 [Mortierella polycephala]
MLQFLWSSRPPPGISSLYTPSVSPLRSCLPAQIGSRYYRIRSAPKQSAPPTTCIKPFSESSAWRRGRFLSTDSSSANNAATQKSLNIRQLKSGTWLPKWQAFTLSRDDRSSTCTFQSLAGDKAPKGNASDEELGARHLLSPQTTLAVFLPKGFPETVTPNYWPFAKWQFIHNVAGSVTAVISTQSLLFAMGLGAGSVPMAAALNWIIKDGLGQLGGVVYASFVSDKFDSEPKRFRFQATVAMQGANVLELLTPLWPGSFLIIASISNIGKNMAWLASSATRAQMNKTFALRDNLGDITGKSGSQTTAAGLVGTGLGVVIAALMSHFAEDPTVLPLVPMCLTFLPFSIFNIYSNYRSSHYVTTSSLNVPRAETVFYNVLKGLVQEKEECSKGNQTVADVAQQLERLVPTPIEVAHAEVFVSAYRSPFRVGIEIEPAISQYACQGKRAEILDYTFRQAGFVRKEPYYIMINGSAQHGASKVVVWFDKEAKDVNIIQGFYHACATRAILENYNGQPVVENETWSSTVINKAHEQSIEVVPRLIEVMNGKGWETDSLFLTDGDHDRIQIE